MGNRPWNEDELQTLIERYPDTDSKLLAKTIARTPKSIRNKASSLKLAAEERDWSFPRRIYHLPVSPELAYITGAILGDGYISRSTHPTPSIYNATSKNVNMGKFRKPCYAIRIQRKADVVLFTQKIRSSIPRKNFAVGG